MFLQFLNVDNISILGFFNELLNVLKALGLNVDDVREQGYDNGSNIKGRAQGYQKRFLEINPKTLYMSCACLNLTLLVIWHILILRLFHSLELFNTYINSFRNLQKDGKFSLLSNICLILVWKFKLRFVKVIRF